MNSGPLLQVHVITPGDHFSPSTGSAVPTVVDGLCAAGGDTRPRPLVLVARGTYPDHYPSADVVEYPPDNRMIPAARYLDVACGRLGLPRPGAGRAWRAALVGQRGWPESYVIGHNSPQLIRYVDANRHRRVLYAHNELFRTYGRREARAALAGLSRLICVSDALAEQTAASLPAEFADRIRVVLNGVDTERFFPASEPHDGAAMTVLFMGRTIADKGPDVLLRAVARAARDDIQVVVVGSFGFDSSAPLTDYEQSLRRIAATIRPAPRFIPFVPRDQVPDLYRAADVLVVPSRWADPCPLTLGEGTASGLPVVGSSIGGIPQSLAGAGILVPPGDPEQLADVLVGLASDPAKRAEIGARARAHAQAHDWTWSRRQLDEALDE